MKQTLAFFFLLITVSLKGQESLSTLALKYPFLDTTKQSIQYYGSDDALEGFFKKLDRTIFEGEGKVNVVHMGGVACSRRYPESHDAYEFGPIGPIIKRGARILFPTPISEHKYAW